MSPSSEMVGFLKEWHKENKIKLKNNGGLLCATFSKKNTVKVPQIDT